VEISNLYCANKYKETANKTNWLGKHVHHMTRVEIDIFVGFLLENYSAKANASRHCGCEFCQMYTTLEIGVESVKQTENKDGMVQLSGKTS